MTNTNDILDDLRLLEPANPWLYAAWALAFVLLASLVLILWRRHSAKPAVPPQPGAIEEDALAELEKIRGMIRPGNSLAYGRAVSDIVRRYIERRFGLVAPRRSTEEFLIEAASSGRLDEVHRSLLAEFLSHCDFMKFGRAQAEISELEAIHSAAARFIGDTTANANPKEIKT